MPNETESHMTEAEIAALADEAGGPNPDEIIEPEDFELDDEVSPANADEVVAADAAVEAEAAAVAEANNETFAPEPVLIAEAPMDVDAKLAEISTQKTALAAEFEDGDLTVREYQAKVDGLTKEERAIERAVDRAELANELNRQQDRNQFLAECAAFMKDTIYSQSTAAFNALDEAVKAIGRDPECAKMTHKQVIDMAHSEVVKDPIFAAAFAQKTEVKAPTTPAKAAPVILPTLGRVPAAEATETSQDRFAGLDRLLTIDPIAYEKAVGKLSGADLDAWLSR